jgi:hypothetical protein
MDIELPILAKLQTESAAPILAKDLRDNELPRRTKSTIDKDDPSLEIPHTDKAAPNRAQLLTDSELPR